MDLTKLQRLRLVSDALLSIALLTSPLHISNQVQALLCSRLRPRYLLEPVEQDNPRNIYLARHRFSHQKIQSKFRDPQIC